MRTFASIHNRPTWITGWPNCWRAADASDPSAKLLSFGFDVTDDGARRYDVLVCFSTDGDYGTDTWHDTLSDAYESAEQRFGIRGEEWGPARDD
jgi:hypothetical protein